MNWTNPTIPQLIEHIVFFIACSEWGWRYVRSTRRVVRPGRTRVPDQDHTCRTLRELP